MLTAYDIAGDATLALPDFEGGTALAGLRERVRMGELVCPTCRQLLWLRAGTVVIPHFAHRSLSECPHGRVSEAVLAARRLLYRFFQARIESGKLRAELVLEPAVDNLPKAVRLDLLLRRAEKPTVHVLVLDRALRPDLRTHVLGRLQQPTRVFRPVFLASRLRQPEDDPGSFLLDTTQREFLLASPYDLRSDGGWTAAGSLHFIDPTKSEWTTLRRVELRHEPQVYRASRRQVSRMAELLWAEGAAEWVHPGEAEALRTFRSERAAENRRRMEERRRAERRRTRPPSPQVDRRREASAGWPSLPPVTDPDDEREESPTAAEPRDTPVAFVPFPSTPAPEPLPPWIRGGLLCLGCGQRTTGWQNAEPAQDRCVCHSCFAAGVRLS